MAQIYRLAYNPVVYRILHSPIVMKPFSKYYFPLLSRHHHDEDVLFFNFGYDDDPPMAIPLEAADEPNRFPIQLYHRTATQVDLTGKKVLEVGCGHGGGASYLARTLRPASYTGLDLNPTGIAFCRKRHQVPGLEFVQGNAQELPFADESFDTVINVESSHCYPDFPGFLVEVARVLRPGGHFLYTDFRPHVYVAEWEAALDDAPLRMLSRLDIENGVLTGIERTYAERTPSVPEYVGAVARKVSDMRGSWLYQAVQGGDFPYRIYSFVKD